jgi:hypothetical protein
MECMNDEIHHCYSLEIQRGNSSAVYPGGTPVLSIKTNLSTGIRIFRQHVTETSIKAYDITKHFLRFQRKCRKWFYIRRTATKWLRRRELRHIVSNLADIYTRCPVAPLRRFNQSIVRVLNS